VGLGLNLEFDIETVSPAAHVPLAVLLRPTVADVAGEVIVAAPGNRIKLPESLAVLDPMLAVTAMCLIPEGSLAALSIKSTLVKVIVPVVHATGSEGATVERLISPLRFTLDPTVQERVSAFAPLKPVMSPLKLVGPVMATLTGLDAGGTFKTTSPVVVSEPLVIVVVIGRDPPLAPTLANVTGTENTPAPPLPAVHVPLAELATPAPETVTVDPIGEQLPVMVSLPPLVALDPPAGPLTLTVGSVEFAGSTTKDTLCVPTA
jgi:hypothetical protein